MSNNNTLSLPMAVHQALKGFKPGGLVGFAGAYGYNPRTLQNKVDPAQPSFINLVEFEDVLSATRSRQVLDAIGAITRTTWVDLGQFDAVGDLAMLDTVTQLVKRVGELSGTVHSALADGVVDTKELADLEHDLARLVAAGHAVVERAKQYMED